MYDVFGRKKDRPSWRQALIRRGRQKTALSSQSLGVSPPYPETTPLLRPAALCPRVLLSPWASSHAGWGMEFSPNRNPIWARKPKSMTAVGREEWAGEGTAEGPVLCLPQPAPQSALRTTCGLTIPKSIPGAWSLSHLCPSSRVRAFSFVHTSPQV